jgi:predicted peroxiredoxin
MATLLISTAVGPADPTRASIPFHIATNGCGPAQVDCGLVLMGDATELVKPGVADGVRGVGVPPLKDLFAGCIKKGYTFYI